MNKTGIIYIATSPSGKSYIGQTILELKERIRHHYVDSKIRDTIFCRALRKYGRAIQFSILYDNVPQYYLNNMEIWCISSYGTFGGGYNSTRGGDDNPMNNQATRDKLKGRIVSKETRLKMSKSRKGKDPWNKGKKLPQMSGENHIFRKNPEIIKKISIALKGKAKSEEHRKKLSESISGENHPYFGKPMPKEIAKKISVALTGKKKSEEHCRKNGESHAKVYKITKPDGTIEIIKGLSKYCVLNNLDDRSMHRVISGEYSHHKGYKCEKIIEDDNDVR